jgi:hypothetical protein
MDAKQIDIFRRRAGFCALFASVAVFTLPLFAERQPYERYQSIVDRQMFGAPPLGFDPTKPPSEVSKYDSRDAEQQLTKEQEQIRSAIHFSVINVTPSGDTAVGFTDNGDAKNPVHYYLKVGEQRNGWLVKEADPVNATMTIAKGEVEVSLSIGGNSANGGGATAKVGAAVAAATTSAPDAVVRKPGEIAGARQAGGGALSSLRARRLLRDQQRQEEAEERRRQEEARREEDRLQREADREEFRAQLQQIQEEQRKVREERAVVQENPPMNDEPAMEPPPEEEE